MTLEGNCVHDTLVVSSYFWVKRLNFNDQNWVSHNSRSPMQYSRRAFSSSRCSDSRLVFTETAGITDLRCEIVAISNAAATVSCTQDRDTSLGGPGRVALKPSGVVICAAPEITSRLASRKVIINQASYITFNIYIMVSRACYKR